MIRQYNCAQDAGIVTPTESIMDFKLWTETHGKGIPGYFGNRS